MSFHQLNPWMKEVSNDGHAEGATLGYTALLEVRRTQATSNGVMVSDVLVEVPVSSEYPLWEATSFEEEVDERPLDLIEAFPNVSASTCDLFLPQLGKLEVERSEVPGIFCSSGGGGTRIEPRVLPGCDPWPNVAKPDGEIKPVDL